MAELPDAVAEHRADGPLELVRALAPLQRGAHDPCHIVTGTRELWRTARMPDGDATARLVQIDVDRVRCEAWGAGAEQFSAQLPDLLGVRDEPEAFVPGDNELLTRLHRAHSWLRIPRTGRVFESVANAVLEQRVTVREALRGRTRLIRSHGDCADGPPAMPTGLHQHPTAVAWQRIPSWEWHSAGVDVHRAATVRRAAQVAARLDECGDLPKLDALRRLRAVQGVGVWTAAEVRQRALGDADAVSIGDTHLARFIGYALLGHEVDDETMHELLEPWRGHRFRVIRLLQLGVAHGVVRTAPRIAAPTQRTHLSY